MEVKSQQHPKISIVMPVYNTEKYIEESIKSILSQKFSNFELIIIFNGTTDNSLKIAKRYLKKDKRIILKYLSEPNVQKALNHGLKFSKGKYIARMDADDISFPERMGVQIKFLEKNKDIFLVGSSAIVIDEHGEKVGSFIKFGGSKKTSKKLEKSNLMIHPSIMFRNTKEFFYRDKFKTSEDYDFYLRILSSNKKIANIQKPLIKYRISKNSFVSTMPNQEFYFQKAKEFYFQRKKFGKDDYQDLEVPKGMEKKADFEEINLRAKISIKFQDFQMREARKFIRKYMKKKGFKLNYFLTYLVSFFPKKFVLFFRKVI